MSRHVSGERDHYPPFPEHYFSPVATEILERLQGVGEAARSARTAVPDFPEALIEVQVDNTWTDTGKALFNNWLGLVYQDTLRKRGHAFMNGFAK